MARRTSTGTVTLFDRSPDSGDVENLTLSLPANYTAALVDSSSSIDLNITDIELPAAGTVVTIK